MAAKRQIVSMLTYFVWFWFINGKFVHHEFKSMLSLYIKISRIKKNILHNYIWRCNEIETLLRKHQIKKIWWVLQHSSYTVFYMHFLLLHNILIEIYDVIYLIMSTVSNSKLHIFLTPTLLIMFAECSVQ